MSDLNNLIDGKAISKSIFAELKETVAKRAKAGRRPGLALILVGNDPGSGFTSR